MAIFNSKLLVIARGWIILHCFPEPKKKHRMSGSCQDEKPETCPYWIWELNSYFYIFNHIFLLHSYWIWLGLSAKHQKTYQNHVHELWSQAICRDRGKFSKFNNRKSSALQWDSLSYIHHHLWWGRSMRSLWFTRYIYICTVDIYIYDICKYICMYIYIYTYIYSYIYIIPSPYY